MNRVWSFCLRKLFLIIKIRIGTYPTWPNSSSENVVDCLLHWWYWVVYYRNNHPIGILGSKVMQTMNWQADASKVAEGFVPQVDIPGTTMEDTAENNLEDFVQRSMVQVSERGRDGSILYCHIHDLLHDIAIMKAREDNFLRVCSNLDNQESCGGARRVAVHHAMHFEEEIKEASPNLRSLLSFDKLPNCSRHGQLKVLASIICTEPKACMDSDFYIYQKDRKDKKSYNVYAPLRYLQLNRVGGLHYSYFLQAPNFLQTLDLRGHSRVTEIDEQYLVYQDTEARPVIRTCTGTSSIGTVKGPSNSYRCETERIMGGRRAAELAISTGTGYESR